MNLQGKVIVLGITGGIAAYKMANVASALCKTGAEVHVIMTKSATEFITPLTFETLTGNKCITDTFERVQTFDVSHVSLAKKADAFLIAPATANTIAKLAHGLADDMLTTTLLATTAPRFVAPSMNTAMYDAPVTQNNINLLKQYGYTIIEPAVGVLACKDNGRGRLPDESVLISYLERELAKNKDFHGMHITVTAGPTQESLDPVRFLTNHSSGKMGYALAHAAMLRGAKVTLIHGKTGLNCPPFVNEIEITSAQELYYAVDNVFEKTNVLIMAAAVADYRPEDKANHKLKKEEVDLKLSLARTTDILGTISKRKTNQFLCGFCMETEHLLERATDKLNRKNLDMIVANNLTDIGAGFGVDTNVVTILTKGTKKALPLLPKEKVADAVLDEIIKQLNDNN